jgi:hypothetical protein
LRDAAPRVLGLRRTPLPAFIVGIFNGAFQPHLDQMQYTPVHDAPRERAHEFGVRDAAEGPLDRLPTTVAISTATPKK